MKFYPVAQDNILYHFMHWWKVVFEMTKEDDCMKAVPKAVQVLSFTCDEL